MTSFPAHRPPPPAPRARRLRLTDRAPPAAQAVGDPIEIHALAEVHAGRPPSSPLLVGSSKGHLGHLNTAAGIASFAKACLVLHHRVAPPSLHASTPTRLVDWASVPIRLASGSTGGVTCVGVSAFGIGGTNAHVVLDAADEAPRAPRDPLCEAPPPGPRTPSPGPTDGALGAAAGEAARRAEPDPPGVESLLYRVLHEPTDVAESHVEMLPLAFLDETAGGAPSESSSAFLASLRLAVEHRVISRADAPRHAAACGCIGLVGGDVDLGSAGLEQLTWRAIELLTAVGQVRH